MSNPTLSLLLAFSLALSASAQQPEPPVRAVIVTGVDWKGHMAKENLLRFVSDGKGLAVIHYASGAFEGWPEFPNLIGRAQQKRHDKRGPFTLTITNPDHPVTRGMKDFETDDELFIELQGDRPIELLATARSKITGTDHPMALVLDYGKGRVFHTALGHDEKALRFSGPSELIRRGAAWAAGRKPSIETQP